MLLQPAGILTYLITTGLLDLTIINVKGCGLIRNHFDRFPDGIEEYNNY